MLFLDRFLDGPLGRVARSPGGSPRGSPPPARGFLSLVGRHRGVQNILTRLVTPKGSADKRSVVYTEDICYVWTEDICCLWQKTSVVWTEEVCCQGR